MTDEADRAQRREEDHRAAALARREPEMLPVGRCLWCGEEVGHGRTFCPPEPDGDGCLRDWQRAHDAKWRNGK